MDGWDEDLVVNGLVSMLIVGNFTSPSGPLVFFNIPVVIVDESSLGVLNLWQGSEDTWELVQNLVIVLTTTHATTVSPHCGEQEECLINDLLLFFLLFWSVLRCYLLVIFYQQTVQNCANRLNESHGWWRSQISNLGLVMHIRWGFNVRLEASEEDSLGDFVNWWIMNRKRVLLVFHVWLRPVQPTVDEWPPTDIWLINVKHTTSWDGSWTGVLQVWNFKQKSHWGSQWNSVVRNECQHLVVIHDSVKWLDPKGVHITVQNCPFINVSFLVLLLALVLVLQNHWQHTVSPLFWLGVMAKQFIDVDCLWIQCINLTVLTESLQWLKQSLPNCCLTATWRTNDKTAVSDVKNILQINTFLNKTLFRNQTHIVLCGLLANLCQVWWFLVFWLSVGEQVLNQSQEDGLVISNNLWNIEISQGSHQ